MLTSCLCLILITAFLNIGLMTLSIKWNVWQYIGIDPCVFCTMFWLALIECFIAYFFTPIGIVLVPIIALASAGIGVNLMNR